MHRPTPLLLALSALTACHATPALDGKSLRCSTDADCAAHGASWRCIEGGCVKNTPPVLEELGLIEAAVG